MGMYEMMFFSYELCLEMFQGTSVSWRLGRTGVYLGPARLMCSVEYPVTVDYLWEHVIDSDALLRCACVTVPVPQIPLQYIISISL